MIEESTQHVGVLTVTVHIPHAQSLKDKRMVLRSIRDRLRNKFNVSVAEVNHQEKWQYAALAFAMIGNDSRHINGRLDKIVAFLDEFSGAELCEKLIEFY